ncbi:fungal-specific transcription factor domain-containing protein [Aspergillus nidulans var. acristatus]
MTELVWSLGGASKTKPPRSLSYTGCWTCRKRRIKCDETPVACRACQRAGLDCAGYDVRLIWNAGPNTSRRRIKPCALGCAPMTEAQVVRALVTIEKSTTNSIGPFSVFASQPPSAICSDTPERSHSLLPSEEYAEAIFTDSTGHACCTPSQSTDGSTADSNIDHQQAAAQASSSPVEELPTHHFPDGSSGLPHRSTEFSIPVDGIDSWDGTWVVSSEQTLTSGFSGGLQLANRSLDAGNRKFRFHQPFVSSSPPPLDTHGIPSTPGHVGSSCDPSMLEGNSRSPQDPVAGNWGLISLDCDLASTMVENTTATMLMDHYIQHVVHLMQPVSHPRNPFKTVYLPLALHGSSQLERSGHRSQLQSASIAAFHSLLSTAAANLQRMQGEQEALEQLACHHKQRSLIALQNALATKSTPYRDLMTAILSLVSADIMDGGMDDHWIHLEAGIKLLASRHYPLLVSRETSLLNNICKMLHLFGRTTRIHTERRAWPGYDYVPRGADFDTLEPSIEFIYGITTSIAGAIFRIYRLSQYLAYYREQGRPYPDSLLQSCETLGDELCSYTINSESFAEMDSTEAEPYMIDIARAQAKAFQGAARIYYYRSIQQCARSRLHHEQQEVLAALNEAENHKITFGKDGALPAPISWPAFVASCEAVGEQRRQWDGWWSRVRVYGMGNYSKQHATVHRVWRSLDADPDESMDWREALAAMGIRILPV